MRPFNSFLLMLLVTGTANQAAAQPQSTPIRITALDSGVDASFRGLAVRDAREAWIAGSNGTVIRTIDGGHSWQRVTIPNAEELDFRDVELLPGGTVLLMSVGDGRASRLLRSVDEGTTWNTVLVNSEPQGFFDGMAFQEDGLKGVLFGDPIDGRMDIYKTSDGGETWKRLPKQQRPELRAGEYGFAASGTGVVTKGNSIWIGTGGSVSRVWHSQDEGTTWNPYNSEIRSGNESSGIFSIDIIDDRSAVAIGGDYAQPDLDQENVAISSDGGKTWLAVRNVSLPHKACVQSLGQGRLLACGRTGVAFSKDAGKSWETIANDGYYTLRADLKSGTGFLAGKDGHVARFKLAEE